jgi:hypothetical protein
MLPKTYKCPDKYILTFDILNRRPSQTTAILHDICEHKSDTKAYCKTHENNKTELKIQSLRHSHNRSNPEKQSK